MTTEKIFREYALELSSKEKLLPCPFCGVKPLLEYFTNIGETEVKFSATVECHVCGIPKISYQYYYIPNIDEKTIRRAAEALTENCVTGWNTRGPQNLWDKGKDMVNSKEWKLLRH